MRAPPSARASKRIVLATLGTGVTAMDGAGTGTGGDGIGTRLGWLLLGCGVMTTGPVTEAVGTVRVSVGLGRAATGPSDRSGAGPVLFSIDMTTATSPTATTARPAMSCHGRTRSRPA